MVYEDYWWFISSIMKMIDGLWTLFLVYLKYYEDYWWLISSIMKIIDGLWRLLMVNIDGYQYFNPKICGSLPVAMSHDRTPAPKNHRGFDKGSEELPPRTLKVYLGTELDGTKFIQVHHRFLWVNSSVNWSEIHFSIHRWYPVMVLSLMFRSSFWRLDISRVMSSRWTHRGFTLRKQTKSRWWQQESIMHKRWNILISVT